uniref:Uncharacterized protein n=1 Tax=Oryza rufipogon TaxID=4529 RepID=A0A0E0NI84_ORYRU
MSKPSAFSITPEGPDPPLFSPLILDLSPVSPVRTGKGLHGPSFEEFTLRQNRRKRREYEGWAPSTSIHNMPFYTIHSLVGVGPLESIGHGRGGLDGGVIGMSGVGARVVGWKGALDLGVDLGGGAEVHPKRLVD